MTLRKNRHSTAPQQASEAPSGNASKKQRKVRTPYHPVVCTLIQCALPSQWRAVPEHLLHHEPQRVDILVILRKKSEENTALEGLLPSLITRLGEKATVLEFKGPTDRLYAKDVTTVLGYGMQLAVQKGFAPGEVSLGVLASRMSKGFQERSEAHGMELKQVEPGVWEGMASGFRVFVLELRKVWRRGEAERLWYVLTPEFKKDPSALKGLSATQGMVYLRMYEQYRRGPQAGEEDMKSWKEFEKQVLDRALARMFEENRREPQARADEVKRWKELEKQVLDRALATLPAQEVMSRYNEEERLQGLSPEQVRNYFNTGDLLQGLSPDVRLQGLSPDDLLRSLSPDMLMALSQRLQGGSGSSERTAS